MRKYCLAICIALIVTSIHGQAAQIYKWTDSSGDTHFSDKPHPGAEEIELPKVQTYSTPKVPSEGNQTDPLADTEINNYSKISIAQPEDQTTIRNTQGYVSIIVELKPKLKAGDRVQVIIDGYVGLPGLLIQWHTESLVAWQQFNLFLFSLNVFF